MTVDQTSPTAWQTVALDPGYVAPVIVFGPVQSAQGDPIGVRVRAATATSFPFQLDEWDYQDGIHPPEKVSFVVLESGTHYIAGRRWIAGRKGAVTHAPAAVAFTRAFDSTPLVLTQVATNAELSAVSERLSAVSATSFSVQLREQEADTTGHLGETVHYIAAETGVSRFAATHFLMQTMLSANDVTSSFRTLSYTKRIVLPHILGDVQTLNDAEPIVPRITNVYESNIAVRAANAEGTVNIYHYGHANYYDMLASHVTGNFRTLLEDVSKHPIMGQYLSSLRNQKAITGPGPDGIAGTADDVILVSPDENYAREVMQLFSIGLVYRHLDGSLKLDASTGAVLPTDSNLDITNLARVFTGWAFSKNNAAAPSRANVVDNTNFTANSTSRFHQAAWTNPMKNFDPYHDTGSKVVLGSPISAGLSGEADLDAALDIIHNHPNVAPFIARLLIQRLVTSNPSAGYIYRVHSSQTTPQQDLETLQTLLDFYRRANGGANPSGAENEEIVEQLRGKNAHRLAVLPPDLPAINGRGQLLDRWGTPYFFQAISRTVLETRTAGPDRKLWTRDDMALGRSEE